MKTFTTLTTALTSALILTSSAFADKIYWTDSADDAVKRSDSDGSNVETLVSISGISDARGIAIDVVNSKLYWTDVFTGKISRANLDGSGVQAIITSGLSIPETIVVDNVNSKIYWADSGIDKIQRADLDGSNVEDVVTGLNDPKKLQLDLNNSKIYWTDAGLKKIQRADLDGSNVEDVLTTGLGPRGLGLDVNNSKVYWIESTFDRILRANLDGSSIETIVTGLNFGFALDVDVTNGKIYWTDISDDKIQRANLDGSSVEDVISVPQATGIDLDFGDNPLAVELDSFQARQIENKIQLKWSTASEKDNEGFNVYRKVGNGNFTQIASYKGNSELLGALNSSTANYYSFVDNSELRNNEFYTYYVSDVETNGVETEHKESAQTVKFTVSEEVAQTKLDYVLEQNFPNPFNPSTKINFQIAKTQNVKLQVYNLNGKLVKELVNENLSKGSHSANWDGTDSFGNQVSSGTYFYKISAGTFTQTNRMVLLK